MLLIKKHPCRCGGRGAPGACFEEAGFVLICAMLSSHGYDLKISEGSEVAELFRGGDKLQRPQFGATTWHHLACWALLSLSKWHPVALKSMSALHVENVRLLVAFHRGRVLSGEICRQWLCHGYSCTLHWPSARCSKCKWSDFGVLQFASRVMSRYRQLFPETYLLSSQENCTINRPAEMKDSETSQSFIQFFDQYLTHLPSVLCRGPVLCKMCTLFIGVPRKAMLFCWSSSVIMSSGKAAHDVLKVTGRLGRFQAQP